MPDSTFIDDDPEDNGTPACLCHDGTFKTCPVHGLIRDATQPTRTNHFAAAVTNYVTAHPSDTKFAAEVIATMGYSAICQHLAELTEVLDGIANRRSS